MPNVRERSSSHSWWERWFRRRPVSDPPSRTPRSRRPGVNTPHSAVSRPATATHPSTVSQQAPAKNTEICTVPEADCGEGPGDPAQFPFQEPREEAQACPVKLNGSAESTSHGRWTSREVPEPTKTCPMGWDGSASSTSNDRCPSRRPAEELETRSFELDGHTPGIIRAMSTATVSSFEQADRVILHSASDEAPPTGDGSEGEVVDAISPAGSYTRDVDQLRAQMGECQAVLKGITSFSYETKEKKRISELTVDAQTLVDLWREALDKKEVLSNIIRECTDAAQQSSDRLSWEVRELDLLYRELSEALANLRRTTDTHKAVKKDIKNMKMVVSSASVKEQVEVGKVASLHEKEVYSKWQSLKGSSNVPALEELHNELTEKQRAISGLDVMVCRKLQLAQSCPGEPGHGFTPPSAADATATTARKAGKVSQRIPVSPGRRGASSRSTGKRKLADDNRHERKVANNARNLMMIQYQGGPVGVASQASLTAAGTASAATATTSTAPPPAPPPPPPPPPPLLPASALSGPPPTQMLRLAAVDADDSSGAAADTADETSTSNEDETGPDADELALAAAFPLHFSAAIFDGLDPTDSADIMADVFRFH